MTSHMGLQYTYCAKSQDVKTIRQWKFGQLIEYSIRTIFLKNHTENVMGKLFPEP